MPETMESLRAERDRLHEENLGLKAGHAQLLARLTELSQRYGAKVAA